MMYEVINNLYLQKQIGMDGFDLGSLFTQRENFKMESLPQQRPKI